MAKIKKISDKEKVKIYEDFFHRLHFHRYLTFSDKKVREMLELSDNFVNAHSPLNVEGDDEVQKNVNAAIDKMRTLP